MYALARTSSGLAVFYAAVIADATSFNFTFVYSSCKDVFFTTFKLS